MKVGVVGCAHGELQKVYATVQLAEAKNNLKVDLLICCGDFQSTRNQEDLLCMNVPAKYASMCTFYKYYSGELIAPVLTIFIGGNHEASNYLQELPYGGWVAPNVYYMGYAGVINVGGLRIGGISGIYKGFDYNKGHYEKTPYSRETIRSVYHIRSLEIFRLKQLSGPIDIFLSHDWPAKITKYGDVGKLLRYKKHFKNDIMRGKLGSPPCEEVMHKLKPRYYFAAHLHCKFPAIVPHFDEDSKTPTGQRTKFLALDKCLPHRNFLQILDIEQENADDDDDTIVLKYDLEWLAVLFYTNHMTSVSSSQEYMPSASFGAGFRFNFTPTESEKDFILRRMENDLIVPLNFKRTVSAHVPRNARNMNRVFNPQPQINEQTTQFCEQLGIDDPMALLTRSWRSNPSSGSKSYVETSTFNDFSVASTSSSSSMNSSLMFVPKSVELKLQRKSMTLPEPKNQSDELAPELLTSLEIDKKTSDTVLNDTDSVSRDTGMQDDKNITKKWKRRNESIYKDEKEDD